MDISVLADQEKAYLHQHCADTGCRLENVLEMMVPRWRERKSGKSALTARLDDDDDDDGDETMWHILSSIYVLKAAVIFQVYI